VPTVSTTPNDAFAADWVGIGGYGDPTLIQAGVSEQSMSGVATYYAWTEVLPAAEDPLPLVISPGDTIKATVHEDAGDLWSLKIEDRTSGLRAVRVLNYASSRISAETIHERPSQCASSCSLTQLAQTSPALFDPGTFTTAKAGQPPIWTPNFHTAANATLDDIVMINDSLNAAIATPSAKDSDDDGFLVADTDSPLNDISPPAPPAS
jgi:hypothetical protein